VPAQEGAELSREAGLRDRVWRVSPDRRFDLVLSVASELAMGLPTWSDAVITRVEGDERTSVRLPENVQALRCFYPWDSESTTVVLPRVSRSYNGTMLSFHDPSGGQETDRWDYSWLDGLAWSPAEDRLLLIGLDHCAVLGADRTSVSRSTPPRDRSGPPIGGWTPSGREYFVSVRDDGQHIGFYDADNGDLTEEATLDPVVLLPYDQERLRSQAGQLMTDSGVMSVRVEEWALKSLMHSWVSSAWDSLSQRLLLATYRPTFELTSLRGGQPAWTMSKIWIAVELVDQ